MGFVSADIMRKLGNLDAQSADAANFGIVQVDDAGKVLLYNKWEAQLAGINQQSALGKNFFLEVAPCTNNRLFIGRFKQGVQTGTLETAFNYTFTYKIKPTNVAIQMYRHPESNKNFIFVQTR
jgi:photoactive yellow protein